MIQMRNVSETRRDVRRATKRYVAEPGEVVSVWPVDRDVLTFNGFAVVTDRVEDDTPTLDFDAGDGLDDLTVAELRDVASDRDLPGRANLNRGELLAALRDTEE